VEATKSGAVESAEAVTTVAGPLSLGFLPPAFWTWWCWTSRNWRAGRIGRITGHSVKDRAAQSGGQQAERTEQSVISSLAFFP